MLRGILAALAILLISGATGWAQEKPSSEAISRVVQSTVIGDVQSGTTLRQVLEHEGMGNAIGEITVSVKEVTVLRFASFNKEEKYWPVEVCAKLLAVNQTAKDLSFGQPSAIPDRIVSAKMRFAFSQDDFGDWHSKALEPAEGTPISELLCGITTSVGQPTAPQQPGTPQGSPTFACTSGSPNEQTARQVFVNNKCDMCHSLSAVGITKKMATAKAPDLSNTQRSCDWMGAYIRKENTLNGKAHIVTFKGSDADLQTLARWLAAIQSSDAVSPVAPQESLSSEKQKLSYGLGLDLDLLSPNATLVFEAELLSSK